MLIGLVGKPNSGKSTLFSAATLVDVEISNRIFTTIEPNKGVTYVRVPCPCKQLNVRCNAQNSKCIDGMRFVPVKMIDIAGLVPDAHKGKGLGNQFLSDIMEANALVHVIDISGSTDENGNPCSGHDPKDDIKFLEEEIDYWILGILKRNFQSLSKRIETTKEKLSDVVYKQLSGLGVKLQEVEDALNETGIATQSDNYELLKFIKLLREKSKPIILAANKIDIPVSEKNVERLTDLGFNLFPCSAVSELALRRAAEKGIIRYTPGAADFELLEKLDERRLAALNFIRDLMKKHGSTGVQEIIDTIVFKILDMIVVYPVENEHKFSDKKDNVLPHALLMKRGATALDLAFRVHEDIGKKFVAAIDARTGRNVSASYQLKNGDVISIRAGR
ncbi:MAG: redox-regulated ATPase YchF [Candidatus Aenigmatarchaeota archaeon]